MCYTIPLATAIITTIIKRVKKSRTLSFDQLNLMLWGGSLMLVFDHLLQGEIFLNSPNLVKDLLLGVAMIGLIFIVWGAMILIKRKKLLKSI